MKDSAVGANARVNIKQGRDSIFGRKKMSDAAAQAPGSTQVEVEEPELDEVKPGDLKLVKDVISVLLTLQHPGMVCKKWTVKPWETTHYDVTGNIDTKGGCWEVTYDDLDTIRKLDYARIGHVSVKVTGMTSEIYVRVLSHTERVMVSEIDIIRVRKRSRWFS